MQNDANAKFSELVSEIKELRSEMATKTEVKAGEDRLLQVISWRLAIMLAFFTVIGAGLISLVGGGSP
ncbi:MAG: hypothetical protein F4X92_03925 [Gammaproteobacteria bacterium]|nr:hypothetical protein [Gammaproteobacteria bacterium]